MQMSHGSQCQVLVLERIKRDLSFKEHEENRAGKLLQRLLDKDLVKEAKLHCF
jgi:hypothetical protein